MKINFHIYEKCNMKCSYCIRTNKTINILNKNWKKFIDIVSSNSDIDFINIAGGEPTIDKKLLIKILEYIRSKNLKSSIISNGFIFSRDHEFLNIVLNYVEWVGISIDSLNEERNIKIGRSVGKFTIGINELRKLKV